MSGLRNRDLGWWFALFCCFGCSTSSYQVLNHNRGVAELRVTPDRVLLECEDIYDHSEPSPEGNFGFMIHILDDRNDVLTVTQTNVIGRSDCEERLREIGKILKGGRYVHIGVYGDVDQPREIGKYRYRFLERGEFPSNGQAFQFGVIWNADGRCFDAQMGDRPPCPDGGFPMPNLPAE